MRIENSPRAAIVSKNVPSNVFKSRLKYDSVSFSGVEKSLKNNPNVALGYRLGMELYKNSHVSSKKIIGKYAPDIEVIAIDDTPKNQVDNADACIFYTRNEDFKLEKVKIYALLHPKTNFKVSKLIYSLLIAHEFTHYLQLQSKEEQDFLKEIADGDYRYLRFLTPIGDGIFDEFDEMKFSFTKRIFNFKDMLSQLVHSFPLPREQAFTKQDILDSGGVKDKEEFKEYINEEFDRIFDRTIDIILNEEGSSEENLKNFVKRISLNEDELNKFKDRVRKYCSHKARTEYEAYKVEELIIRHILDTKKQLNVESYTVYYSMLENALK